MEPGGARQEEPLNCAADVAKLLIHDQNGECSVKASQNLDLCELECPAERKHLFLLSKSLSPRKGHKEQESILHKTGIVDFH